MKVILTKDVANLGRVGDVKEVANGYARNFLMPRGLVVPATAGQLKQLHVFQARREKEDRQRLTEAQQLAQRLEALQVVIPARVGEQGRLYGSITASDIADELTNITGGEIDHRKVRLDAPIKEAGSHEVVVDLTRNVKATVIVEVGSTEE